MWKLFIEDDDGKRTALSLTRDEYTIGRREGSAIRLTERNVSRDHARICRRKDPTQEGRTGSLGFVLEDLSSYNGVFVNGLRIADSQVLEHGDLVQIGDYRIVLSDDTRGDALDTSTSDVDRTLPIAPRARASELMDRPNRFVMLQGPTPGAEFPVDRDKMTIGRTEDANIFVNDNSVSRLHCEIHAFGDGRFEIVDMGSSNGVQVNGSELRRGIVEPGDTIELGDVRFKFVGAGQIFRPDAQPTGARSSRARRASFDWVRSNALPLGVFVTVALTGIGGAWAVTRSGDKEHRLIASPETTAIEAAARQCAQGDCEGAHLSLQAAIPESSTARESAAFIEIESQWADGLLAQAASAQDIDSKRAFYKRVSQTASVDAARRKVAADRLQELDSTAGSTATAPEDLPRTGSGGQEHASDAVSRSDAGQRGATADNGLSSDGPTASSERPAPQGVDDRERELALSGTPDSKLRLKQQLEPRVYSGHASEAEIRLLISVCKDVSDRACVQQARAVLKEETPTP